MIYDQKGFQKVYYTQLLELDITDYKKIQNLENEPMKWQIRYGYF